MVQKLGESFMKKCVLLLVLLFNVTNGTSETLMILDPSDGGKTFSEWQEKSFEGNTQYERVIQNDEAFISARASGSASGLFLEKEVNLSTYPVLNWRWRVDKALEPHDEKTKGGDDFSARLYVVVSGGLFFWKTIALNYVWSSNDVTSKAWANPFAGDNAQMLPVRGAAAELGVWHHESRNLKQDFKMLFDKDVVEIDGVAIMTDTDNGGGEAQAAYAEIFFSKE